MKNRLLSVAMATALSTSCIAFAVEGAAVAQGTTQQVLSEATVKKLDAAAGRLTLAHGPIANLNMPPMTMTFAVRDKALLKGIKAGDPVRFRAEQIDDKLVVTQLKH